MAEKAKSKKADLEWLAIDESGTVDVTKDMDLAAGFRHTITGSDESFSIMFSECKEVMPSAAAHGIRQKSTDTASSARSNYLKSLPDEGKGSDGKARKLSESEQRGVVNAQASALAAFYDALREGTWLGGAGESIVSIGQLAEALARSKGMFPAKIERAREIVEAMTKEARSALRKDTQIDVSLKQMALERAENTALARDDGDSLSAGISLD